MDALFRKSDRLLANTSTEIVREKMNEIHWNAQLISIMGARVRKVVIRGHLVSSLRFVADSHLEV